MINLIIFGPPGAGKGTQSNRIVEKYKLIHLSTGDLLRSEIADATPLGMEAKTLMDQGLLVPDQVVIGMIRSKIEQNPDANGFIFDGFPRTEKQAEALDELLEENNTSINIMLALFVEKEELIKRIINRGKDSGRSDDTDRSIIDNRIDEYNSKTKPLIKYYERQNKYRRIEGSNSIDEIFEKICVEIEKP
ncbi:MAG TPA: adenylate kinase [Bacteroidia bacterium]|nr:adenylate kinase [Bacteroidia bacterium]HNT79915.1 adenylate kinase [Bacteroidia bacterium]